MRRIPACMACLLFAVPAAATEPGRWALLVGCTKYQNDRIPELFGPARDVHLFADLLKRKFHVPPKNIQRLVVGAEGSANQPTAKNIALAMETLIEKASPGTRIVVFFAGHGTQTPIPESQSDPLDPRNPEPDGLDEVFLPIDVASSTDGRTLPGAILDDQISGWLRRMRERGADVWAVFDCCHSGTMSRVAEEASERPRQVAAADLGISEKALHAAMDRAAKARPPGVRGLFASPSLLDAAPVKGAEGSLAVFYACQAFEKTPELPLPVGSEKKPGNYHGLLTYLLTQTLWQLDMPTSYHGLSRALAACYVAARGSRAPTPFAEGDLDRNVLGDSQPRGRFLPVLEKEGMRYRLSAGRVHGVTKNSVLSVHAAANDLELGRARVVDVRCDHALVEPFDGKFFPNGARCRVVIRELDDNRCRLAIVGEAAKVAWRRVDADVRSLFVLDDANPEWNLEADDAMVSLRAAGSARKQIVPSDRLELIESALRAVFTWQNAWRLAADAASFGSAKVDLLVEKLSAGDQPDGPLASAQPVFPGQRLAIRLANQGPDPLWVGLLVLDGELGIDVKEFQLPRGGAIGPLRGTVSTSSLGKEGIVVIAVSQREHPERPRFDTLAQPSLVDLVKGAARRAPPQDLPDSRLHQLLRVATTGRGARQIESDRLGVPTIRSWTWFTRALEPNSKAEKAPSDQPR